MRQYRTNGKVERKKIKYGEREKEREKSIERNAQYLSNIIHVRCVGLNTDLRERKIEREKEREKTFFKVLFKDNSFTSSLS